MSKLIIVESPTKVKTIKIEGLEMRICRAS